MSSTYTQRHTERGIDGMGQRKSEKERRRWNEKRKREREKERERKRENADNLETQFYSSSILRMRLASTIHLSFLYNT